ncbi:MAG: tRNA dihydrouridine synthase DusB [Syntrophales bacterium]|nr:tRNA dihydrouridine synthase DusB [Syntrophales bacterium]
MDSKNIQMKIGNLQLKSTIFLAPLAGITDLPFRTIVRSFGCDLAYTEMISAVGLVRKTGKTLRYLASSPLDRPLGVQLFGNDPEVIAEAARIAEQHGADLIDFNMGCPVKKVTKAGAGSALMKEPQLAAAIMQAVRKATALPFTVKIRSGWSGRQVNALEIGKLAEDAGCDAVTLHPRTADQGYSGRADWDLIAALKGQIGIPVIGSGDIRKPQDAARMFQETGCDGAMIGRGALGNPWIIAETLAFLAGNTFSPPTLAEREEIIIRHLALVADFYGEQTGVRDFRKHLLWYTKGLTGGARFREAAGKISSREAAITALHNYFLAIESDK